VDSKIAAVVSFDRSVVGFERIFGNIVKTVVRGS